MNTQMRSWLFNGEIVHGFSRSALFSYFLFPKIGVCFDLGFCPWEAVPYRTVLISHPHGDHTNDIMRHVRLSHMQPELKPAIYFMPKEMKGPLTGVFEATAKLHGVEFPQIPHFEGMGKQDTYHFENGQSVLSFDVSHRGVPSRGYIWGEKRIKLKPEYTHYSTQQIADLLGVGKVSKDEIRQRREALSTTTWTPLYTLIGDHDADTLENPEIWKSQFILLECTYLDDEHRDNARKTGHTHIADLKEILLKHWEGQTIVLKHFSMRYSPQQIREAFKNFPVPVELAI